MFVNWMPKCICKCIHKCLSSYTKSARVMEVSITTYQVWENYGVWLEGVAEEGALMDDPGSCLPGKVAHGAVTILLS